MVEHQPSKLNTWVRFPSPAFFVPTYTLYIIWKYKHNRIIERGDTLRIERVNTNQIRCTLSSVDLKNRNLDIVELTYGSDNAKSLFQEMLSKASYEVGFDADDSPLMIEAVPLSNDSIIIYVTKVDDPDELDSRFARFSPTSADDLFSSFDLKISNLLEGALDLKNDVENEESSKESYLRAYSFNTLDEFIDAAKAVKSYSGENTLYKDEINNRFILVLKKNDDKKDFSAAANILSEYGIKLSATSFSEDYYKEHYKIIIKENAITQIAKIWFLRSTEYFSASFYLLFF